MALRCRNCGAEICEDRLNVESGVACCPRCAALWRVTPGLGLASVFTEVQTPAQTTDYDLRVEDRRFILTYPIRPPGVAGSVVAYGMLAFGIIWLIAVALGMFTPGGRGFSRMFTDAFKIPFYLAGLADVALAIFLIFGRGRLTLAPPNAWMQWGLGGLGYKRRGTLDDLSWCKWHEQPKYLRAAAGAVRGRQGNLP